MSYGRTWHRLTLTTYCPRRWLRYFFAISLLAVDVLLTLIFDAFSTALAQSFAFDYPCSLRDMKISWAVTLSMFVYPSCLVV